MSDRKFLIYKFTSPSGLSYIGQTCNLEKRIRAHKNRGGCTAFHNAIKKHGFESFTQEILHENLTIDEANYWEEFYIREHQTLSPNGYNLLTGGSNSTPSEETRAKLSKAQTNRSPEHRARMSEANRNRPAPNHETRIKLSAARKGIPHTEESKQKISIAQKDRVFSTEHRNKISNSLKGISKSNQHRENLSKSRLGSVVSAETKLKISKTLTGKAKSVETCKKLSDSLLGHVISDETKEKIRIANTGKKLSPETIAKREATRKINRLATESKSPSAETREKIAATLKAKPTISPEKRAEINEKTRLTWLAKKQAKQLELQS